MPHYLADIESDMSAVHRVDDVWSMPAARFFALAWRLPCYRGVMRERALAEQQERDETPAARAPARSAQPQRQARAVHAPGNDPEPVTRQAAENDPVLSKIFSFS